MALLISDSTRRGSSTDSTRLVKYSSVRGMTTTLPKPVMFQKWRSPSRRKVPASLLGQAEPGGAQAAGLVLHAGVVGGAADVGERHDDAPAE